MKRFLDIISAIAGILVLWPVALLVAVAVKMTSPGPVLFHQERMGRYGHTFDIVKFRTMAVENSYQGCQVTAGGDPRITPVGQFLRRHKLDELPQLLNVLRGEMSVVGPRPEVPEFAELFPLEYAQILKVRPGITHPATLSFRREEEILAEFGDPRKFYIDQVMPEKLAAYEAQLEQSLAQDIRTIVETIMPQLGEEAFGPEHFRPLTVVVRMPEPIIFPVPEPVMTVVENIPAYAAATVAGTAVGVLPAEPRFLHEFDLLDQKSISV